ncbi:MAG TPA: aspartate--tRNA ligase [Kineosporiaceae bacterium]|nr:aspartate--tRNA ligase [Kineosporiaceae bacterium]
MNAYRTHVCRDLGLSQVGNEVRVAGWLATVRDHGGLLFADIRDHSGRVQVVFRDEELAQQLRDLGRESVLSVDGAVVERAPQNRNPELATGDIEIVASAVTVLSRVAQPLPFEISEAESVREEVRLAYRFLDLRSERLQRNIRLRYEIVRELRRFMDQLGFVEIQTPVLTSSSPEGARDYLVPSRRYPGCFYALPQAPQQFKQLLMTSGFERYFQIAPCFRDEDGRADRSPGEFYQLDLEMAFATQEDVFAVVEQVLDQLFTTFSDRERTPIPFPRIPFAEAMLKYGTDKPDLRNPLVIVDLTDHFQASEIRVLAGKTVRALRVPGGAQQPRKFFDALTEFAKSWGAKGMAWLKLETDGTVSGSIAKAFREEDVEAVTKATDAVAGDAILFAADTAALAARVAGALRTEVGRQLDLLEQDVFRFCWIVDFPMYERNEETGQIEFSHNPFSMPQGGAEALKAEDPTTVLAYQYDIVCNGYELSSGAVRNHDPELMVEAFGLAGYSEADVRERFGSLYSAFQFGAPPHAGIAPGIDRIIMLLADESIIRDVVAFPMTVNARDLLMKAPAPVTPEQLRELHITVKVPPAEQR